MAQWIETKLSYEKIDEQGKQRKVTETYLVDALSFAEAEVRITVEMKQYISGEFTVSAVKKAKITEVISGYGGWWYKLRVMFISIDERTGAAKKTPHDFLVEAQDIEEAIVRFMHSLQSSRLAEGQKFTLRVLPLPGQTKQMTTCSWSG